MPDRWRTRGVLQGLLLLGPILLMLLLLTVTPISSAPRPNPVHVYEGYSSIGKSVTVTKRLVFHMNKDQSLDNVVLDDQDGFSAAQTNKRRNSSDPQVNHSVQYSIETNLRSNLDGDLIPPMTMETITNDLNEMQKVAKNGFKLPEDYRGTTNSITTPNTFSTRFKIDAESNLSSLDEEKSTTSSDPLVEEHTESVKPAVTEVIEQQDDISKYILDIQGENNLGSVVNLEDNETSSSVLEVGTPKSDLENQSTASVHEGKSTDAINMVSTTPLSPLELFSSTEHVVDDLDYVFPSPIAHNPLDEIVADEISRAEQEITSSQKLENTSVSSLENEEFGDNTYLIKPMTDEVLATITMRTKGETVIDNLDVDSKISDILDTVESLYIPNDVADELMRAKDMSPTTEFLGYLIKDMNVDPQTEPSVLQTDDYNTESFPATEPSDFTTPTKETPSSMLNKNKQTQLNEPQISEDNNQEVLPESSDMTLGSDDAIESPISEVTIDHSLSNHSELTPPSDIKTENYNTNVLNDYNNYYVSLSEEDTDIFETDAPLFVTEPTALEVSAPPLHAAEKNDSQELTNTQSQDNAEEEEPSINISKLLSEIDFSNIDFSNLDLSTIDLSAIDLGNLDLSDLSSTFDFKSFDFSKLPANLDLSSLDLSTLTKDLDLSAIDLSKIDLSNLPIPNPDENESASLSQSTKVETPNFPSPNNGNVYKNAELRDDTKTKRIQLSKRPGHFNPNVVPPFLTPNFDYETTADVNRFEPLRRDPPAFIPSHYNFRVQESPHFSPSNPPQFFVVDNFGDGEFVDPTLINIHQQDSPDYFSFQEPARLPYPTRLNLHHQQSRQSFTAPHLLNIRQHGRLPDPNLLTFREQVALPEFAQFGLRSTVVQHPSLGNTQTEEEIDDKHKFGIKRVRSPPPRPSFNEDPQDENLTGSQDVERRPLPFNVNGRPTFDLKSIDLSHPPANLNLGNQDLSLIIPPNLTLTALDLSNIVANLDSIDLSKLDLSSLPPNLNLAGIDLSKVAAQIDFSTLDLSKINIPEIVQNLFKPNSTPGTTHESNANDTEKESSRKGLAIRDLDYANLYDYADDQKMNVTYMPPMRAENVPGSSQWVTEEEADQHLVEELGISHLLKISRSLSFDGSGNVNFLLCTMCKTGIVTGKKLMNDLKKTDREIKSLVIYICIQFDLFPKEVCRGMINIVGDEIMHVLRNTVHSPEIFCGMMLNNQCDDAPFPPWLEDVMNSGDAAVRTDPVIPTATTGNIKILHISDLHLDSEYSPGSDADCGYPLCCRDWGARGSKNGDDGNKNKTSIDLIAAKVMADADDPNMDAQESLMSPFKFPKKAGRWGSFGRCDLPLETIDNILAAGAALKPDIVYVTGDLPAHDVWQQTRDSVKKSIATNTERIRAAFPHTPVVMAVGNHEIVPINSFPVPSVYSLGYNPSWLYESLAQQWADWVPEDSVASLRRGGYYVTNPRAGLRVISINGNYCNSMNWWLLLSHQDPTSQLQWLKEQLTKAEAAGEAVHILTHIPPGNADCEQNWSRQFASLVTRFASTVRGIFSGHQHLDQWQVMYDPRNSSRAVSVVYIAPSATTFREHSPSFRLFDVDGAGTDATWSVVDHHTYTTNLTIANMPGNTPEYKKRYSAREAFGMSDLSPDSWAQVVDGMAVNKTMFNQHMRFKHNYWAEPTEIESCDRECKERSLCFLVTGDSSNKKPCEAVKSNIV